MKQYDVVVIGAGPAGYVAAIRASQLGKNVAIIEKDQLGGVCLNWGCIPTKSLLKSAELYDKLRHAQNYGIKVKEIDFDIKSIVQRSRNISLQLTKGINSLMKKNKITVIKGEAVIKDKGQISVNQENINANKIIIATGARPRILSGFEPDNEYIWTSKEAMMPDFVPESLIIVGSGAIGIEYASFYNSLGCKVTVLEAQNRILPVEDQEISKLAQKMLENKGIKILTRTKLLKSVKGNKQITVELEHEDRKQVISAEKLLVAIGITANIEDMGLDKTNVKIENGHIVTNQFMQTADVNIYAIGDVAGAPWLAHKASHEAIVAAEHIAGLPTYGINKNNIPGCTYSNPQIASVGLTEEAAISKGLEIRIGRFPFIGNGRALVLGENEGLIKTIFDSKTGELLGAHMVGAEVAELIQGFVIAKGMEATELDLMHTIFAHPTLSEMMHESVLQAFNKAIHI